MFWKLEDARLVQERAASSAANADTLALGVSVPEGKVWIITACRYIPSVGETQTISFYRVTRSGVSFPIFNPVSYTLNPASATFIEQGMEYVLFAGESLSVRRGNHTAASTMDMNIQLIEVDLPLYTYQEPQEVKRQKQALSTIRRVLGGGVGGAGSMVGSAGRGVSGGGGGGAEPV